MVLRTMFNGSRCEKCVFILCYRYVLSLVLAEVFAVGHVFGEKVGHGLAVFAVHLKGVGAFSAPPKEHLAQSPVPLRGKRILHCLI